MADEQVGKLQIVFEGKIDELTKSIDALKGHIYQFSQESQQNIQKTSASWQEMAKGFIASNLIIGAFEKLKTVITGSIALADEDSKVMSRLATAIGTEGAEALEKFALAQQKVTLFSKDQVLAAGATLAAFGKNKEQILSILPALEDFATATGKTLPEAATLVNRAMNDANGTIRGTGVQLEGTAGSQERLNSFLKIAATHWHDQAKNAAESSSGLMQFQNEMHQIQEDIGKGLAPALKLLTSDFQTVGGEGETLGTVLSKTVGFVVVGLTTDVIMLAEGWQHLLKAIGAVYSIIPGLGGERTKLVMKDIDATLDALDKMQQKASLTMDKIMHPEDHPKPDIAGTNTGGSMRSEKTPGSNSMAEAYKKSVEEGPGGSKWVEEDFKEKTRIYETEITEEQKLSDAESKIRDLHIKGIKDINQREQLEIGNKYNKERSDITFHYASLMSKARDNSKELEQLQKEQQGAISLIDKQESEERINQAKREHDRKVQYGFEVANQFVSTLTTMAEATKADAITKKRIAQLGAIVSGAQAVVNAMIAPPPLDMIMAGLIGVQVAAQIAIIENTKYGEGGPIKGRSHSSGGVHIEAEGGEYIQRREAVDYYGVSAMEAINRRMIPKELFASIRGMNITFPGGTAASGGMVKAGASGVSVSMVNFVDPQLMNKYMKTTAGKKAMVNFISDNSYEVKQALSI